MQLHGGEKNEHERNRLRLQIKDTTKLDHARLVEWLCDEKSSLKYIPENTLDLNDVPAEMPVILSRLKQMEQVFIVNS